MNYEDREKVYTNALMRFGEEHQMVVAIEEMSELQKELTKLLRGTGNAGRIAEETADVLICMEQIIYLLGIREMVDIQMDRKVMRLEDNLKKEAFGCGEEAGA